MGIRLYKFLPKDIKKLDNFNCLKKSKINFIEGIFVYARRIFKHQICIIKVYLDMCIYDNR